MTKDEVISRLKKANRAEVERETRLPYRYLRNLIEGDIENPGSRQMDMLRAYFGNLDKKSAASKSPKVRTRQ